MILDAGRATLELANPAQVDDIDDAEVGRTGVSPPWRVAVEVDEAASVTRAARGRRREHDRRADADPVALAQRAAGAPAGVQLTVFTELD